MIPGSDETFDDWALKYDEDVKKADEFGDWILAGYFGVFEKIVEYCELDKYTNPLVLDIGAGTGTLAAKLLEKGCMVTTIEPSEKMREVCREKHPDIEVLPGDFLDIPLPPQCMDIIVSSYAFYHVTPDEKEVSISLMKNILHKGGRIVIADVMFKNPPEKERIIQSLLNSRYKMMVKKIEKDFPAYFDDLEKVFTREGFTFHGEQLTESIWIICAELKS
jgi:putative AdoMet-dependent methyltransferase